MSRPAPDTSIDTGHKVWYPYTRQQTSPTRVPVTALRKITVQVPEDDLEMAQAYTGEGVTETVRAALKKLANMRAQQELLKLRGSFQFSIDSNTLREDR